MPNHNAQVQGDLDKYLSILQMLEEKAGPDCSQQELTTLAFVLAREAHGARLEERTFLEHLSINYVLAHVTCRHKGEIL